jgi:uncharacterized protein
MKNHPCQRCGACCAYYRVSFHWTETSTESFHVPIALTTGISPYVQVMNGTNQIKPNCVALVGLIGSKVSCSIYENRPGACRNFKPSYEDGLQNTDCETARTSKGLEHLTLADWA